MTGGARATARQSLNDVVSRKLAVSMAGKEGRVEASEIEL